MGIAGSGISAAAAIARKMGFKVSGCDLNDSPYAGELKKMGIVVEKGHDEKHLDDVDILAISPAVLWQNGKHAEYSSAKEKGIVMTWQELMGKTLQKEKYVVAVAGTHGKSTTTAMIGKILTDARLDPTCEVGAFIPEWGTNYRIGNSKYFVCEADEFNDNFLNYEPDVAIITSLEFDHPEYFKTFPKMVNTFKKFIKKVKNGGTIILGLGQGAEILAPFVNKEKVRLKTYSIDRPADFVAFPIRRENNRTIFSIQNQRTGEFVLKVPGFHNVKNALAAVVATKALGVEEKYIKGSLSSFGGAGRRFELMGEKNGVKIFNDYAHHPTAVEATLEAAREKFPKERIWAVFQPHTYSRTKALLKEFSKCFSLADKVIITEIFASREQGKPTITTREFTGYINHDSVMYLSAKEEVADYLLKNTLSGDIVINMGAGDNYKITDFFLRDDR